MVRSTRSVYSPHGEDLEELNNQGGCCGVRVDLTDSGHQDGPGYPAQEAQLVGINVTLCRETSERQRKGEQISAVSRDTVNTVLYCLFQSPWRPVPLHFV